MYFTYWNKYLDNHVQSLKLDPTFSSFSLNFSVLQTKSSNQSDLRTSRRLFLGLLKLTRNRDPEGRAQIPSSGTLSGHEEVVQAGPVYQLH